MKPEEVADSSSADTTAEAQQLSPGKLLRQAREQQGLTQQDVANKIYIKPATIEALEQDQLDDTMSVTFIKGYVRNYAKFLGLDDVNVIAQFDRIHSTPKSSAQLQSFSQRVAKQANDDRWMMVTWAILFLLLAGVVAWWYQQDDGGVTEDTEQVATQTGQSGSITSSGQNASDTTATIRDEAATPSESDAQPDSSAVEDAMSIARDAASSAVDEVKQMTSEPSATQTPETTVASTDEQNAQTVAMSFTFGEDCWVNITDATGEQIAHGTKRAGRTMQISGQPPIKVTLGAPDAVSVYYAGQSVDISQYQNGRTARFTLPMQE